MSDDQVRGAILAILGPDPTPSILFGAPSVSLQQLAKTLQLDAHTLDPTRVVPLASGVGRELAVRHEAEHRQLKRGKVFEDWIVFKADDSVKQNAPSQSQAKIHPVPMGSGDQSSGPSQASERVQADSRPDLEKRFGLRLRGRKKVQLSAAQSEPETQPIWKQPPHRINSQLITTLPLLPQLASPPPPSPPPSSPQPLLPPPAQSTIPAADVVERVPPSTTAVHHPHSLPRDVPKLILPTLAEVAKKRKTDEERGETRPLQEEQPGTGHQVMPERLPAQGEDDEQNSQWAENNEQDSQWSESLRRSDEEIDPLEDPPATSSSVYSAALDSTTLSDYPDTPSSAASAESILSDTPALSVPPSPWLNKAFHDLPFGPNVPALQLAEWLQARWQILVAQLVAVGAAVYVLQATGL